MLVESQTNENNDTFSIHSTSEKPVLSTLYTKTSSTPDNITYFYQTSLNDSFYNENVGQYTTLMNPIQNISTQQSTSQENMNNYQLNVTLQQSTSQENMNNYQLNVTLSSTKKTTLNVKTSSHIKKTIMNRNMEISGGPSQYTNTTKQIEFANISDDLQQNSTILDQQCVNLFFCLIMHECMMNI